MPDNKTPTNVNETTTGTGTGDAATVAAAAPATTTAAGTTTTTTTTRNGSSSAPSSVYAPDTTALKEMIFAGDPDLMMCLDKGERANKSRRSWYTPNPGKKKKTVTFSNTVIYIEPLIM